MPELPEVETVRRTLSNCVPGAEILSVTAVYPGIIEGDAAGFCGAVRGRTVRAIDRAGKYLIFVCDDTAFISHLRMEGKYNITASADPVAKHEHIIFHLADGRDLRYHDTRKFGRMWLTDVKDYRRRPPLSALGPEPWDADPGRLHAGLLLRRLPLKSLLLDQGILAGIGNIYANEICFRMKIDPRTPGRDMTLAQTRGLLAAACRVLDEAIALGGSSIHSFEAGGVSGRFQHELRIHGRGSCPDCGTAVTKMMVGGRGTYWCAACQKR